MASETATQVGHKLGVVLAIADFPILNAALRAVIDAEPDMAVVGEIADQATMREQIEASVADIVVTDCLPFNGCGHSTFETIEAIRAAKPGAKILALGCLGGSEQFSLALKAGANGFLTRSAQLADVVNAVRCISRGQTYVSPAIVTRMVNTYLLKTTGGYLDDPYDSLSEREREVLLLAAAGNTNREIARILHLSEQTVHHHRAYLMEKLGFHDRVELLKYAIRRGVLDVADL